MENACYQNHTFHFELGLNSSVSNPEGGNRTLRTRIRGRHVFRFFRDLKEEIVFPQKP